MYLYLREAPMLPWPAALILLFLMACTASDPAPLIIENDSDDDQGDLVDATPDIQDVVDDTEVSRPPNSDEFRKPLRSELSTRQPTDLWTPENQADVVASEHRIRSGGSTRDHMPCIGSATECFLFEGEYFVLDISVVSTGRSYLPNEFFAVVLHEGQPLPFRFVEVDERFVPMEEIESWGEEDYRLVERFYRENKVPYNYTLIIPPWAFPERGHYNLQFLTFPDWHAGEESAALGTSTSATGHGTGKFEDRTFSIYYGGNEFKRSSQSFRNRNKESIFWESPLPGPGTAIHNFQLLTPPRDICDWQNYEETPFRPACLTEIHDIPADTATLEMHTVGGGPGLLFSDTRDTNLYYVMRDDEVIDAFLFHPEVDSDISSLGNQEVIGVKLPIQVELTDEKASYQVVAVPQPFEAHQEISELILWHGNSPNYSNALLLRRAPERTLSD